MGKTFFIHFAIFGPVIWTLAFLQHTYVLNKPLEAKFLHYSDHCSFFLFHTFLLVLKDSKKSKMQKDLENKLLKMERLQYTEQLLSVISNDLRKVILYIKT
jgi:hypothetical protein